MGDPVTFAASGLASVAAGLAVSNGQLLPCLALPPLVMWQRNRRSGAAVAGLYFLAAGRAILDTGPFLAMSGSPLPSFGYWYAAAMVQSLAWACTWGAEHRALRTTVALLLTSLPPLGFVSWAHPFHAAGLLFPAVGVIGLLLCIALTVLVVFEPVATVLVIALALPAIHHAPEAPAWSGMRTRFEDVFRGDDPLGVMDAVSRELERNPARVQVWPESIVPHWNEATESFWSRITTDARSRGKTMILGSTIGVPDARAMRLRNVAIIKGSQDTAPVDQRTPIPGGTWHPFTGEGVPLSPFTSAVREIAGQRAAFLICYEQLLAWTYVAALFERPTIFVGLANVYWVRETSIPAVQTACLRSWARLLNIPFVEAVNQ